MYDVSGIKGSDVEPALKEDWDHIVSKSVCRCGKELIDHLSAQIHDTNFLQSPAYLHERGRPVIAIWGMGMSNDAHDVESLIRLVRWIKQVTPGGAYVFAGTPSHWRTRDGDCDTRPEFDALWAEVDCVSPRER